MKKISDYFLKFKKLTPPEASKKKIIKQVIKQETGFDLLDSQIILKTNTAQLVVPSVVKAEILSKKQTILNKLSAMNANITILI